MLLMALLCHLLPMLFQYGGASVAFDADSSLQFSRAASIVMVIAYFAYLIFQLWTHRQLFEAQDVCFVFFNFEMVKLIVILYMFYGNV
jgi:Ca2+:H+ antiporter